jgi:hypothetical protein
LQKKEKGDCFSVQKREGEGCAKKERRNTRKKERKKKYKETMWDEKSVPYYGRGCLFLS